jgi:DNA-binding MurR/RpiR family transcriptional regulator
MADTVPDTADAMRAELLVRYDALSGRLQQIGRFVLDHPNDVALETLAVIASRCDVQPSAIVRFAKSFGFEGASQMQRLFRDELLQGNAALGYSERVRQLEGAAATSGAAGASQLLTEFVEGNLLALDNLKQTVSEAALARAVGLIADAASVHVVGYRRSFPIAAYLAYSLLQAEKRTIFVDGTGGLAGPQLQTMTPDDALIAVSFHPYAEETMAAVEIAAAKGATILAISDSLVSPIAKRATVVLQVRESEVRKFRSLSASMCLSQALVINYAIERARRTAPDRKPRRIGKRQN